VDDPRFSTVLGLLKMAAEEEGPVGKKKKKVKVKSNEPGIVEKMQKRIVQGKMKLNRALSTFLKKFLLIQK